MTTDQSTKLVKLRDLLRELFQLDQADLDFGIYRIMNQKRDEVERFLDDDLLPQVRAAFEKYRPADKAALQAELDKLLAGIAAAGMNPGESPKVTELRERLTKGVDVVALEDEVFSDLFTFFRRYYHGGDFLSLRRYKEGVYAVPYEGEEVKLHWANHDQYYIKSSERLTHYAFKVGPPDDQRRVRFELVVAGAERDNNKAQSGDERRFILAGENPVVEDGGDLVVRFEYRSDTDGRKQEPLNAEAAAAVMEVAHAGWKGALGLKVPTKAAPNRTILDQHIRRYTARNAFDYFIHKDLRGFLRRELDFFIKNEILLLDDIDQVDEFDKIEEKLSKVRVLRAIAHKIIDFVCQLEDFQKKLWLKKKFVVETNWCITLDRVPEEFYPEIASNHPQREAWVRLFSIDTIEGDMASVGFSAPLTVEFLQGNAGLVLNTLHFDESFTERLIAAVGGALAEPSATLVCSENLQALRNLMPGMGGRIGCVYIDPPYNTGDGDFPYKDAYQQSSWLTMMRDRLELGRELLAPHGVMLISIDRNEMHRLVLLADDVFGQENRIAEFVWEKGRKNDAKHVTTTHEFILAYARDYQALKAKTPEWRETKDGVHETMDRFRRLRKKHGDDFAAIRSSLQDFVINKLDPPAARSIALFRKLDERGPFRDDTDLSWPGPGGPRYEVTNPETGDIAVIPKTGWRFKPETMKEMMETGEIEFDPGNPSRLRRKRYLEDFDVQVKSTNIYKHSKAATRLLRNLFNEDVFDNPKDPELLASLIGYVSPPGEPIVDYFAGSGTTAQAAFDLSRRGTNPRAVTLVEMGEYFDRILLPRVLRNAYSDVWKAGRPQQGTHHSVLLKCIRLESYDDALDNLELRERSGPQQQVLASGLEIREDYMLSYMLDIETEGSASLLNIEQFRNPFVYKLKVTRNNETQVATVDIVETFNYLIGLRVEHMAARVHRTAKFKRDEHGRLQIEGKTNPCEPDEGWTFRVIQGRSPDKERTLVIWRVLTEDPEKDNLMLDTFCKKMGFSTKDMEFDLIYVNGDNNLENLRRDEDTWKVQLIEENFHRLMFDISDV